MREREREIEKERERESQPDRQTDRQRERGPRGSRADRYEMDPCSLTELSALHASLKIEYLKRQ